MNSLIVRFSSMTIRLQSFHNPLHLLIKVRIHLGIKQTANSGPQRARDWATGLVQFHIGVASAGLVHMVAVMVWVVI